MVLLDNRAAYNEAHTPDGLNKQPTRNEAAAVNVCPYLLMVQPTRNEAHTPDTRQDGCEREGIGTLEPRDARRREHSNRLMSVHNPLRREDVGAGRPSIG